MKINKLTIITMLSIFVIPFLLITGQAQWFPDNGQSAYPNSGISRFRWEGVVDGTSYVRIRGRQVNVETSSGLPVQRQRFEFSDPLPRSAANLELSVFDGRGRVRLVEEPRQGNNFSALVRIDDRSGGRDFYSFELRWYDRDWRDNGGGWSGNSPRNSDYVTWRGRVDGESIVRFRSDQSWNETVNGYGINGERFQFSAPLPARAVDVNLNNTQGRGEILIIEQPSRSNGFTASVLIRDRQSGASNYAFSLAWEKQNYRNPDQGRWRNRDEFPSNGNGGNGRGITWSGRVDGTDLIYIRGNQLWIDHRSGQPIYNADYRFYRSLPNRQCTINVRRLNGRGNVRVIEHPSPYNNYTAAIMIEDRDGGSDNYELEIDW